MINLKIIYILLFTIFFSVSCSTKIQDRDLTIAMTLTNRATEYQLKGDHKMASYSYTRAIQKFRDLGSFCNMARVSIILSTNDILDSKKLVEDAIAFSTLGKCEEEINISLYLNQGSYNINTLPEPYKSFAKYDKTKNVNYLLNVAKKKSSSERVKSIAYRKAALAIMEIDPIKAYEYAEKAVEIDSKNAWTANLIEDEKIKIKSYRLQGKKEDILTERLRILQISILEQD